jgi:hypothetical protein
MQKTMNYIIRKIALLLFATMLIANLEAQDLQKDVTVVKSYQPILQDAAKISQMPVFNDTLLVSPTFEYSISPIRLNAPFKPRPVNAAKIVPEPIKNLYSSYLKLGFGYPVTPLAELNVANMRSKANTYGVYLKHYSANGSVTLPDKIEVKAPFSENIINVYGKHIFKESELSGNIGYSNNKLNYYGYDSAMKIANKDSIDNQLFQKFSLNTRLESLNIDSTKLYYILNADYNYLKDNFSKSENNLNLSTLIGKRIGEFYLGGNVALNHYNPQGFKDTANNTLFCFRPRIGKAKGDWRFDFGFDGLINNSNFYSFIYASLDFAIVPSVLRAYIGYDGNVIQNTMASVSSQNPYIYFDFIPKNSILQNHIYGGLKGSFSENMNFVTNFSYSKIDDYLFFVNDTVTPLHNKFQAIYDNIERLQLNAGVDIQANENLKIGLKGEYSWYTVTHIAQPWHLPNLNASASVKYNLRDKIVISSDLCFVGKRFAKAPIQNNEIELSSFFDVNLGVEYRYTKVLSFFLQIKNITASKYDWWNQYPAYRFQMMGGLTYAL